MDRIVGANTIDLGGGKRGFRGKDTVAGIAGTELAATWHNQIQEEQMTLIEGSGQVPADGDLQQLAKAYQTGRFSFGGNAGGTANALAITLSPQPNSWDALIGAQINLIVTTNNTAAATLAIAGLPGTKPITRPGGAALSKGDLVAGMVLRGAYDGTSVQMAGITQSVPGAVQVYATPGTTNWTVPTGVFKIRARVWGAGGGGGALITAGGSGAGGDGGGYAEGIYDVTPGQVIPIVVGAGGIKGTSAGAGSNAQYGGTSSVGSLLSGTGGGGGGSGYTGFAALARADPGIGIGGQINLRGQAAANSYVIAGTYVASAGAGAYNTPGTAISSGNSFNGQQPAGGSSGVAGIVSDGQNGAHGMVIIEH